MQEAKKLIDYYLYINGDDFIGVIDEVIIGEIKLITRESKGGRLNVKNRIVGVEPISFEATLDGRNERFMGLLGGTYDIVLKGAYSNGTENAVQEEYTATVQFEAQDGEAHQAGEDNKTKITGDVESLRHVFNGVEVLDYKPELHSLKVKGVERFPGLHAALN